MSAQHFMLIARTGNTVCTADGRSEPGQKSSVAGVGKCRQLDTVRVGLISPNNTKKLCSKQFVAQQLGGAPKRMDRYSVGVRRDQ